MRKLNLSKPIFRLIIIGLIIGISITLGIATATFQDFVVGYNAVE